MIDRDREREKKKDRLREESEPKMIFKYHLIMR